VPIRNIAPNVPIYLQEKFHICLTTLAIFLGHGITYVFIAKWIKEIPNLFNLSGASPVSRVQQLLHEPCPSPGPPASDPPLSPHRLAQVSAAFLPNPDRRLLPLCSHVLAPPRHLHHDKATAQCAPLHCMRLSVLARPLLVRAHACHLSRPPLAAATLCPSSRADKPQPDKPPPDQFNLPWHPPEPSTWMPSPSVVPVATGHPRQCPLEPYVGRRLARPVPTTLFEVHLLKAKTSCPSSPADQRAPSMVISPPMPLFFPFFRVSGDNSSHRPFDSMDRPRSSPRSRHISLQHRWVLLSVSYHTDVVLSPFNYRSTQLTSFPSCRAHRSPPQPPHRSSS
jgi:hypothetical protein